jgi:hypothetical protein
VVLQQPGPIVSHLPSQASRSKQKQHWVDSRNEQLVLQPASGGSQLDSSGDESQAASHESTLRNIRQIQHRRLRNQQKRAHLDAVVVSIVALVQLFPSEKSVTQTSLKWRFRPLHSHFR